MEVYRHQVGGHTRFVKPRDSPQVLKPFSESEFQFYETLSRLGATSTESGPLHILKKFVPEYYGVTEVHVVTKKEGQPSPSAAFLPLRGGHLHETADDARTAGLPRYCRAPVPLHGGGPGSWSCSASDASPSVVAADNTASGALGQGPPPVHQASVLKYIVLQDLVHQYSKPCVLDLKMGKRQRKIGASQDKERRQLEKSLKTTSHAVGFRLCGFQSYDAITDALCYRDKYWGRRLTPDDVLPSIRQWFWDGTTFHRELLHPLISSLKVLYACVSELRHYRFWSSSLLWFYDAGMPDARSRIQSLDVKMIDFANTIILKDDPQPDEEYLIGLANLMGILEQLLHQGSAGPSAENRLRTSNDEDIAPSVPPPSEEKEEEEENQSICQNHDDADR